MSSTYLRTAFTPVAPKSVRIQSSCQYLFTLLGSTGAKAALRMLVKLTPDLERTFVDRATKSSILRPKYISQYEDAFCRVPSVCRQTFSLQL